MDGYFLWLCRTVHVGHPDGKPYYMLCSELHNIEFRAMIPYDKNRAKEGLELRENYIRRTGSVPEVTALNKDCTVFELMVALALRMEFEDEDGSCPKWFYHMVRNLGLDIFTDTLMGHDPSEMTLTQIHDILEDFMKRNYKKDGSGHNIFVTNDPLRNLKFEELFYQMGHYLAEFGES